MSAAAVAEVRSAAETADGIGAHRAPRAPRRNSGVGVAAAVLLAGMPAIAAAETTAAAAAADAPADAPAAWPRSPPQPGA